MCGTDEGRLAADQGSPAVNRLFLTLEEDAPQQVEADTEDGLGSPLMGLDHDRTISGLPFTGRVGEREGDGEYGDEFGDPFGVDNVGIFEVEAPRLDGPEQRLDLPAPTIVGQGGSGIGVGCNDEQVSTGQASGRDLDRRAEDTSG